MRLHEAGTIPSQRPLAIAYVEVAVNPGASAAIGRFYRKLFRTPVDGGNIGGRPAVSLNVGPFQSWRFVERDCDDHATHSMHVSFYATDYAAVRAQLMAAGATSGGRRDHVFFFDRIADPETGETVFTISNEVRSIYHPDFRRQLVNRWPIAAEPFSDTGAVEAHIAERLGFVPGT